MDAQSRGQVQSLSAFRKQNRGFTLIEMIVIVAIVGMVVLIGVPAIVGAMKRARLESAARQAQIMINATRLQAVKSGTRIAVYFGAHPTYPHGAIQPFIDANANGAYNAGEEFKRIAVVPLPNPVAITSTTFPGGVIAFNGLGQAVNVTSGTLLTNCGDATNGCAVYIGDAAGYAAVTNIFKIGVDNPGTGRTSLRKKALTSATYVDAPWKWTY